jgi:CubicO group peptidase (beta-lactamase class C family)
MSVDAAREVIDQAMRAGVFPAASVDVGNSAGPLWQASFATPIDTLFDLASLTKVIATTTAVMRAVAASELRLDLRVADFFDEWRGQDRESVTIRDLLEHASGLAARLVDAAPDGRREFEHEICTMKLEYLPRSRSIYSDLGFILLGFLVRLKPDATIAADVSDDLLFNPPPELRPRIAPTLPMDDDRRRGRVLVGEVHDNYAAALEGVAGHAGLFGTAGAVGEFARAVLRAARGDAHQPAPFSPALVAQFTTKTTVPGSSRALGWDTMLPTSSCGTRMSAAAFGHVGFTGTSLWIDPRRDRYFVLLTNRKYGGGTLEQIRDLRRAFHDALGDL